MDIFLQCMYAKNYRNGAWFNRAIAEVKGCKLFWGHSVVHTCTTAFRIEHNYLMLFIDLA